MRTSLQSLPTAALAELLTMDPSANPSWDKTELAPILRHLLTLPVERATCLSPSTNWEDMAALRQSSVPPIVSLRNLLEHPKPPLQLLYQVKDFAKICRDQPEQGIPTEIAVALYFVCTARALICHQTKITSLNKSNWLEGLQWLEAQTWADPAWALHARGAATLLESRDAVN